MYLECQTPRSPSQIIAETTALSTLVTSLPIPMKATWLVPGRGASRTHSKMLEGSWMLLATVSRAPADQVAAPSWRHHLTFSSVLMPATTIRRPLWSSKAASKLRKLVPKVRPKSFASAKGDPAPSSQFVPSQKEAQTWSRDDSSFSWNTAACRPRSLEVRTTFQCRA